MNRQIPVEITLIQICRLTLILKAFDIKLNVNNEFVQVESSNFDENLLIDKKCFTNRFYFRCILIIRCFYA